LSEAIKASQFELTIAIDQNQKNVTEIKIFKWKVYAISLICGVCAYPEIASMRILGKPLAPTTYFSKGSMATRKVTTHLFCLNHLPQLCSRLQDSIIHRALPEQGFPYLCLLCDKVESHVIFYYFKLKEPITFVINNTGYAIDDKTEFVTYLCSEHLKSIMTEPVFVKFIKGEWGD
jgi:hypothetical protein